MGARHSNILANMPSSDPLRFWPKQKTDFERVRKFLDLNTDELSKLSGLRKQSIRLDSRIPAVLKDRLEQIAIICSLVAEHFDGDSHKTVLWFKTPNPMLGYVKPRDMIRLGRYKKLLTFIMESRKVDEEKQAKPIQ